VKQPITTDASELKIEEKIKQKINSNNDMFRHNKNKKIDLRWTQVETKKCKDKTENTTKCNSSHMKNP